MKEATVIKDMIEAIGIRNMTEADRAGVYEMMSVFYASDAVHTNGSHEIFNNDINECLSNSPFLSGFVFVREDESIGGYAMTARNFSAEYGMPCIWIEDIYLQDDMRGLGLASRFLDFIKEKHPGYMHRLEAEDYNEHALEVYRHNGFETMPYVELFRLPGKGDACE